MMEQDDITTDDSTKKPTVTDATSTSSSTNVTGDILSLQSGNVTLSLATSSLTIDGTIGASRISYVDEWLRPQ